MARKKKWVTKTLELTDQIGFGCHKNLTVEEVLKEDPAYLGWAITHNLIDLTSKVYKKVALMEYTDQQENLRLEIEGSHSDIF